MEIQVWVVKMRREHRGLRPTSSPQKVRKPKCGKLKAFSNFCYVEILAKLMFN